MVSLGEMTFDIVCYESSEDWACNRCLYPFHFVFDEKSMHVADEVVVCQRLGYVLLLC